MYVVAAQSRCEYIDDVVDYTRGGSAREAHRILIRRVAVATSSNTFSDRHACTECEVLTKLTRSTFLLHVWTNEASADVPALADEASR